MLLLAPPPCTSRNQVQLSLSLLPLVGMCSVGPCFVTHSLVEVQDGCVQLVLSPYPAGKGTWESEFSDCLLKLSGSKTHKLEFLNMGTWFQRKTTNENGLRPPQGLHTTQILVPLLPWSRLLV